MRSFQSLGIAVAVTVTIACGDGEPEISPQALETPQDMVLALFDLSRGGDPAAERVDALFGTLDDERDRAARLDAIAELRSAGTVEIVETYPMDDLTRLSFDLEGALAGGGSARYSVQIDTSSEPGVIVWFSGPGVEWPERRHRGPGLSTSAPPTWAEGG